MTTTAAPTIDVLDGLRQEHSRLTTRADDLGRQVEGARSKVDALAARLDEGKELLADGAGDVGAVMVTEAALSEARTTVSHLEAALGKVQAERQDVADRIAAEQDRREGARQETASRDLRGQSEAQIDRFVEGIVTVAAPLVERRRLAETIARDFPAATQIQDVALEKIARRLARRIGRIDLPLWRLGGYLIEILTFPDAHPDSLRDRFGIKR